MISENNGPAGTTEPILSARGLVKRFGKVTALNRCDFDLMPGEILAVIGDNGAGKSVMIKTLSGALQPDDGQVFLDGKEVQFNSPIAAREAGIETVYQTLAMSPALSIADNMFMGREIRAPGIMGQVFRKLDKAAMAASGRASRWRARRPSGRRSSSSTSPPPRSG